MGVGRAALPLIFVLWTVVGFGGCAMQRDITSLDYDLTAVEREAEADRASLRAELERCREDLAKLEEDSRTRYAGFRVQIDELKEEMGRLRGEMEQVQHYGRTAMGEYGLGEADVKNLETRLQSSVDRIVRLEAYLGLEPSEQLAGAETGEAGEGAEEGSELPKTPEGLYATAKGHFDQGEYERARELFRSFLKEYPKSKMADDAQFWLGEIYYREKWYEKAILEYQKVIENNPKGNKTPSALLKQGFAFLSLGDNANARLILKELIRKFPDSKEADIAKNKLKTMQ